MGRGDDRDDVALARAFDRVVGGPIDVLTFEKTGGKKDYLRFCSLCIAKGFGGAEVSCLRSIVVGTCLKKYIFVMGVARTATVQTAFTHLAETPPFWPFTRSFFVLHDAPNLDNH